MAPWRAQRRRPADAWESAQDEVQPDRLRQPSQATPVICAAGMRIYSGTALHRIALEEGVVPVTDNLLLPTFYGSAELTESLLELILAHASRRDNWLIVGAHEDDMRETLARARDFDLRGPLWGYLGQFRRRQSRLARRHTEALGSTRHGHGGTSGPWGQLQ